MRFLDLFWQGIIWRKGHFNVKWIVMVFQDPLSYFMLTNIDVSDAHCLIRFFYYTLGSVFTLSIFLPVCSGKINFTDGFTGKPLVR